MVSYVTHHLWLAEAALGAALVCTGDLLLLIDSGALQRPLTCRLEPVDMEHRL